MRLVTIKVNGTTVLLDEPVEVNPVAMRQLSLDFAKKCQDANITIDVFALGGEKRVRNYSSIRAKLNNIVREFARD